jgi:threonine/homoserine/homoserine lactone efflux protein
LARHNAEPEVDRFLVAFLPQFLDASRPFCPQMAIFVRLAFANAFGYAILASRARRFASSPRALRTVKSGAWR